MPGRGSSKNVRDKDKGYKKRLRTIFGLKPTSLTVGIHADAGAQKADKGARKRVAGGKGKKARQEQATANALTILDVGTIHEFGLGHNPQRSFIRGWADENEAKNQKTIRTMMRSVAQGKRTLEDAAAILGLRFVGDIQRRMRDRIPPPLSSETVKRKGSDVPLIDTGQLRSSIQFKVGYGRK